MRCSAAAPAAAAPVLQDKVQEWLSMDKDAASRALVQDLMAKTANSELEELMCKRLEFGEQGYLLGRQGCADSSWLDWS